MNQRYEGARAAMKTLAAKVENIDLSGSGLVGGKKKGAKKAARKKSPRKVSASPSKRSSKGRSASRKKSGSRTRKASGTRKSKRSGSASKKVAMGFNEHKLADNLIQLGVQLKNMQLDGGRKRRSSKGKSKSHVKL